MLAEVRIKCYSYPMINRKDQIHAAIYNAVVDAGFSLYALPETATIMVKDLLEDTYNDGIADFEIAFTGKDISDVDVEVEGVGLVDAFNNRRYDN
tara:strand:- start:143 stop:427 length:285 start_codon:yes stop_codon:yes gene_type:complete